MVVKGFKFGMMLQLAIGPICMLIFQIAASSGLLVALTGVIAVTLVDGLYIFSAIMGIGAILKKYKKSTNAIKLFGAFILIIFDLSIITGAFNIPIIPSLKLISSQSNTNVFYKILLLTLSNPITIVFWVGVFSAKLTEDNMSKKDMFCFGFGSVLSTLVFLSFVSSLGTLLNILLNNFIINILNVIVGFIIVLFGIKTALKKIS